MTAEAIFFMPNWKGSAWNLDLNIKDVNIGFGKKYQMLIIVYTYSLIKGNSSVTLKMLLII
jgi:hypothetical protein